MDEQFGVFLRDERGLIWRCAVRELAEAKRRAQEVAANEGSECLVFSLETNREIARFQPLRIGSRKSRGSPGWFSTCR